MFGRWCPRGYITSREEKGERKKRGKREKEKQGEKRKKRGSEGVATIPQVISTSKLVY
jgi:hypothetical protein